jgi:putative oxidoreductase
MRVDLALLVLRVAVGVVIFPHGAMKLGWVGKGGTPAGPAGWFDSIGLRPGLFWAWVVILAEVAGGVLTILGLGGPIGPGIVAADLVVVTIVAHVPKGFWAGQGGWEFPVTLGAGALAIALIGNGGWSLDGTLGLTYSSQFVYAWLAIVAAGALLALAIRMFAPKPKPAAGGTP